jgi:tetratricopeptide (TPR) repeat protein
MPQSTICRNILVSILLGSVLTISTHSAAETPRVPDISTVIRALKKDTVKRDKAATISDLMLLRTHATENAAGPSFSANTYNKIGEILEGVGRNRQKEISDLLLSEVIWYFDSAANLASSNNAVADEKQFLDNEINAYKRWHNISSNSREFSGQQLNLIGFIPLIHRILSVSTKLYGRDNISVGAISLNLAYLYLETSQPNDAKIYFQKTIDILRPALSDKLHVSQESLLKGALREMIPEAFVADEQAMLQTLDFAGGLSVLGQYLEFAQSVNDVHETAESLNRIGMHFYYTNDYTTAISYYKKALQVSERGGESEADHTVITRDNLAAAYFGNKQVDEAIAENRMQYKRLTYLNKDGGYSDYINTCQNNYAAMLAAKNVYEKSVAIFEAVIRSKRGKKGFCEYCAVE